MLLVERFNFLQCYYLDSLIIVYNQPCDFSRDVNVCFVANINRLEGQQNESQLNGDKDNISCFILVRHPGLTTDNKNEFVLISLSQQWVGSHHGVHTAAPCFLCQQVSGFSFC